MLDNNITIIDEITLFSINKKGESIKNDAIVISGLKVTLYDEKQYSEIDENNFFYINQNDYNGEKMKIEISINNTIDNPYCNFYMNCLSISIDNKKTKFNQLNIDQDTITKINKEGKIVMGLGYFFKNKKEYFDTLDCNSIQIEGLFALGKKDNVYGFMYKIRKQNEKWDKFEANTYKLSKNKSIEKYIF